MPNEVLVRIVSYRITLLMDTITSFLHLCKQLIKCSRASALEAQPVPILESTDIEWMSPTSIILYGHTNAKDPPSVIGMVDQDLKQVKGNKARVVMTTSKREWPHMGDGSGGKSVPHKSDGLSRILEHLVPEWKERLHPECCHLASHTGLTGCMYACMHIHISTYMHTP